MLHFLHSFYKQMEQRTGSRSVHCFCCVLPTARSGIIMRVTGNVAWSPATHRGDRAYLVRHKMLSPFTLPPLPA